MTVEVQRVVVPETFEATLVAARMVTPRVRELVFERVDGKPFHFRSGQWVSLVVPLLDEKERPQRRSYSIASVPGDGSRFELVVTRVDDGQVSPWLHEVAVGTRLEVKGPQGTFQRAADAGPSLFIATGTGVAPFRGMVHDAIAAGGTTPLWVLFGVRTPNDALYREEFEALAKAHPRLRFMVSMSRPTEEWSGLRGYVQSHTLELWKELSAHGRAEAYVCGVKKMLLEVRGVLKTQGFAERHQLHLESYD
jgi:CDP-4-dehydro-6-deoxyglucose reductase, E3